MGLFLDLNLVHRAEKEKIMSLQYNEEAQYCEIIGVSYLWGMGAWVDSFGRDITVCKCLSTIISFGKYVI